MENDEDANLNNLSMINMLKVLSSEALNNIILTDTSEDLYNMIVTDGSEFANRTFMEICARLKKNGGSNVQ